MFFFYLSIFFLIGAVKKKKREDCVIFPAFVSFIHSFFFLNPCKLPSLELFHFAVASPCLEA